MQFDEVMSILKPELHDIELAIEDGMDEGLTNSELAQRVAYEVATYIHRAQEGGNDE